jgi:hypothetical protein
MGSGMSVGLALFAEHMQQLVADLIADVGDVGGAGLRHPQAEQAHQGAVVRPGGAGRGQQGCELQRCSA